MVDGEKGGGEGEGLLKRERERKEGQTKDRGGEWRGGEGSEEGEREREKDEEEAWMEMSFLPLPPPSPPALCVCLPLISLFLPPLFSIFLPSHEPSMGVAGKKKGKSSFLRSTLQGRSGVFAKLPSVHMFLYVSQKAKELQSVQFASRELVFQSHPSLPFVTEGCA